MYTRREIHTDFSYPFTLAALTHTRVWIVNWITPIQEWSRTSIRWAQRSIRRLYYNTHRFLPRCWLRSIITATDLLIHSHHNRSSIINHHPMKDNNQSHSTSSNVETNRLFAAKRWQYWIVFSLIVCTGRWCHRKTTVNKKVWLFMTVRCDGLVCHFLTVTFYFFFCVTFFRQQLKFNLSSNLSSIYSHFYIRKNNIVWRI